jgi:hypothetical protein
MAVHLVATFLINYIPAGYTSLLIASFALLGSSSALRVPLTFVLMLDPVPKEYHSLFIAAFMMIKPFTVIYYTIHFMSISKNYI